MNDTIHHTNIVKSLFNGLQIGDTIGGPTQMATCLYENLMQSGKFSTEDILESYYNWWKSDGFDTGPTVNAVFSLMKNNSTHEDAVKTVHNVRKGLTAGCNPAHRAVVLSVIPFIKDDELGDIAKQEALITHYHPIAGDVSAAVVILCRALIRGNNWQDAKEKAKNNRLNKTLDAFNKVTKSALIPDGYAPNVLQAAIYFLDNSDNLEYALNEAIEFAGPTNYCPVLVGAIGGLKWENSNNWDEK